MRTLSHQQQVDFFAESKKMNLTFDEIIRIVIDEPRIIRNSTLYVFLKSKNTLRDQTKQLDRLFKK